VKAAGKLAEMIGRPLSHEQKKKLGPVVHYSFCTLQSGVYGAVAEWSEGHGFIAGLTFGAALFVAADEVVVPALSLSPCYDRGCTAWAARCPFDACSRIGISRSCSLFMKPLVTMFSQPG
jgi:hypothetical protein